MIAASLARLRQQRTAPLILELDLTEGLTETRPADPVSAVMARHRLVLADALDGLRRAGEFTWGACAAKTLDVYREVAERRRNRKK